MRFKEYKNGGGIDPNYYSRLSEIESNNNPQARSKTSSASGKFQFIKSTWEGLTKKYGLPYNLEDRFDPEKSKKVAELYTQENANYLKSKLGITPSNTDLYAAHFMGVGGASKLLSTLKQNPNASAYDVASPAQIAANKAIFLRKDGSIKTAKEVYDTLNYKVTKNKPQQEVNIAEAKPQQSEPYQFREIRSTDYYAPQVSQNISSLDNTQETINLAEDKAAEIKNKLDQKKAEKAFIEQMIKATQVAYVNPEDYQSKPTFEEPQEQMFQQGGISQFKKQPFQLKNEVYSVSRDATSIPNTKRDLSLMLAEYNNAKKDEQELRTTGQIKNPNSIQYRRNVKTQPDIKQDNISTEQRNAPLNPLQRPLIYLANPEKVLGDLGVPNMETSELDRQKINTNKFNPYQSRTDRFLNNAKIGLGYVPQATVNTAMAAAFMPEGSGALGLVNETLNPLAGTNNIFKVGIKQVKNQADIVKDLLFDKNTILNKNFIFDTKDKIYNQIEQGYSTLDSALEQKINDLQTFEGMQRLVNQEKEYLQDFYYDPKNVDLTKTATENAKARIEELENIKAFGNKNKEFVYNVDRNNVDKVGILKPHIETVQYAYDIPTNNAHYQYNNNIIDNPSGTKMIPGKLTLGRGYEDSTPTAFHEINHALQRGRTLKIDDELKNITPDFKKNLSYDDINAYTYFKSGSDGKESSSFLAELRSQMQKDGFIKNTYDEVSPDLIEKAKDYYSKNKNKKVFASRAGLEGITNTRILDFSRATPENYKIISDAMNKLPAVAPIAGATYLANQSNPEFQQGGQIPVSSQGVYDFKTEGKVIKDNNGYWNPDNWGKAVEISSNHITMEGVKEPLYVVPDVGQPKLLFPNQNHIFPNATKVTEYPIKARVKTKRFSK